MSKFSKVISILATTLFIGTSLTGCTSNDTPSDTNTTTADTTVSGDTTSGDTTSGDTTASNANGDGITVSFWSAPEKVQYNYWVKKVEEFNATKTELDGKVITVEVQQMPESPSSEAGIQNAIATGTVPAVSENINRGFAATLADSDAIYPLEEEEWFKEAVASRKMEDAIKGWELNGHQYVLPEYVNPIIYQWNMAALRELGINEPPKTVDELKNVIAAFRENKDTKMSDMGVLCTYYRPQFYRADAWWERWFDFQTQYEAFSGGKPWVEGNTLSLDKDITKDVFELFGLFGDTLGTAEMTDVWKSEQVPMLAGPCEPWSIEDMRASGKTYGLDGDYVYGQTIVKNESDTPYCFGDAKGLVLYKNDSISEEEHLGAVEFVKWAYAGDNSSKTDLDFLQSTTMLPVRGDLTTNDTFKEFLDQYPELQDLAQYVPYTIPAMSNAKMSDIQAALTESGFSPYITEVESSSDPAPLDASSYVDAAFDAMKEAGELE